MLCASVPPLAGAHGQQPKNLPGRDSGSPNLDLKFTSVTMLTQAACGSECQWAHWHVSAAAARKTSESPQVHLVLAGHIHRMTRSADRTPQGPSPHWQPEGSAVGY